MLSCTSSNKLTKGKNQRVSIQKMDRLCNRVEHWETYPIPSMCDSMTAML